MLKRLLHVPPEHLYPADPWRLVEERYDETYFARAETGLALSNGYIGVRGTFDEAAPAASPGVLVNGFHETWPIVHAEEAFGLARTGQTLVQVPDATVLQLYVDDEPLFVPTARLRRYQRVLDMRGGTLDRDLVWATPAGRHVALRSRRLVSLEHRHLMAIEYQVVVQDASAPVVICSRIVNRQDAHRAEAGAGVAAAADPRLSRRLRDRVLTCEVAREDGWRALLGYRTARSRMTLGVGVDHVVETELPHTVASSLDGDRGELVVTADARPGAPIRIVKSIAYHSSRSAAPEELVARCERTLDRAVSVGFQGLADAQRVQLDRFWDRADVRVTGPGLVRTQQAIRWNLFQLAQATWRAEGSGVAAKGLTGSGYEGHFFWDTEVYLLAFLSCTWPRIARNLLRFRHSMLPQARRRARELGQRGAMFPWRTINGEEASAYYQAGTAQYHINADIAYAIRRYVHARGDDEFLVETGAEMLVESARLWEDIGFYADDGRFHIHGVTGPDEYTTVVNDNAYTNLMA